MPNGRKYKTKQASAQEAHEAIRPTDISKSPDRIGLDSMEAKLYRLIWERTVASQMQEAQIETTTYHFSPMTPLSRGDGVSQGGLVSESQNKTPLPPLTRGPRILDEDWTVK